MFEIVPTFLSNYFRNFAVAAKEWLLISLKQNTLLLETGAKNWTRSLQDSSIIINLMQRKSLTSSILYFESMTIVTTHLSVHTNSEESTWMNTFTSINKLPLCAKNCKSLFSSSDMQNLSLHDQEHLHGITPIPPTVLH